MIIFSIINFFVKNFNFNHMDKGLLGVGVVSLGFVSLTVLKHLFKCIPDSVFESNSMELKFGCVASQLLQWINYCHLIPLSWIASVQLRYQSVFRSHVTKLFQDLPPTGLYKEDINEFKVFIKHALGVFNESPRSKLLKICEDKLISEYKSDPKIRELIQLVCKKSCDCNTTDEIHPNTCKIPNINFRLMIKSFEQIEPGKIYKSILKIEQELDPDKIFNENKRNLTRENILKKNKDLKPNELNEKVENVYKSIVKKCESKKETLLQLRKSLLTDKQYSNYKYISSLWNDCKCNEMAKEYITLEKQIGYDRCSRGNSFEDRSALVFEIIKKLLPDPILNNYYQFSFVQSALWKVGKHQVGEIDMTIMGKHKLSKDIHVVAIVEMKSNFYSIASAWCTQHSVKISDLKSHTIQLPNNDVISLEFKPEFYVVTLIPYHRYLIGADKSILDKMKDRLLKNEITDEKELTEIMNEIRTDLKINSFASTSFRTTF